MKNNRHIVWRGIKWILRIFKRKPEFVFLGDEFCDRAIYISNHVAAQGPLTYELYFPKAFRFWGIHNMAEGLGEKYKYLSTTYFQEKKHFPKFVAKFIAIFATPVMAVFYWGINLLPTYQDARLAKTFNKSLEVLKNNQSILIFPENSNDGYHKVLKEYFAGFYLLAKKAFERGMDLPIYNMYYQKKKRKVIVDKPIKYSKLADMKLTKDQIAEMFRVRANELGQMEF